MYFGPTAHVLRVSLRYIEPEVWHRLTVPSAKRLRRYSPLLDCFHRPPISVVSTEVGQTGAMEEHHGAGGSLVSYVPAVVAAVFAGSDAQRVVVFGSVARCVHVGASSGGEGDQGRARRLRHRPAEA